MEATSGDEKQRDGGIGRESTGRERCRKKPLRVEFSNISASLT